MPWKPIVDGFSSTPFMPMSFEEAIRNGNFPKDVPFVAGFTSEEGLVNESEREREGERGSERGREREKESIRKGNFPKDVPFVAGFTSEEGLVKFSI
jgi:hypothetical protein